MAEYRQLLLSTGGGIVSDSQQDEQNVCATVAIGLGGTGVSCLRNLKKQVYSRLQPDDPNDPIPKYSHISFLAVDSDKSSLGADGAFNSLDETTEFFPISTGNITGLLRNTNKLAGTPELDWLKTQEDGRGLTVLSTVAGAGGVRQIGRLLLIQKSDDFCSRVEQAVTSATRGLPGGSELVIHIFAGIGGGTGSGTFLDACYLVQKALERVGGINSAKIFGYVFLPDVNLSTLPPSSSTAKYVKANGFAAMKELDYCMNFQNNHGSWDQQYKGFHIGPTTEPPVQICHLISAHDVAGQNLPDGFAYAMNVVSDFVMQFLVKPQASSDPQNQLTINSHIDNYYKKMEVVSKTAGAGYKYCLLGASNAIVPMKEISTYLASSLFENMSAGTTRRPTDEEVTQFAEGIGLTYDKLKDAILNGTTYRMPLISLDYKACPGLNENDLDSPDILELPNVIMRPYREKKLSPMKDQVSQNMAALTNPWSADIVQKDQQSVSKVCAAFFALKDLVVDPDKGPFYAAEMLNGSQTDNLVNHLYGFQREAAANLKHAREDLDLRISQVKRTRHEFLKGKINLKRKFEDFIVSVSQYFSELGYIYLLEQMESMLPKMAQQFTDLYTNHFMVYQTVSQNLFDTFHNNYQALTTAALNQAISDPFILPLMEIADMKPSLDNTVKSMNMEQQTRNFHEFLFGKPEVWAGGDEHLICKTVSTYLTEVFHEYTNKSLTEYLEIRFDTSNPAKLQNEVYQNILLKLESKAEALFWPANRSDLPTDTLFGYISVPDSAPTIMAAADTLNQKSSYLTKWPSKLKDRIFILKCICGVPMYTYNGLYDYENEYNGDTTVGKHLYERTRRNLRDWRGLPNLQPYSTLAYRTEAMDQDASTYHQAVEMGIVRAQPDSPLKSNSGEAEDYEIVVWPPVDPLLDDAKAAIESNNTREIKQAIEAIDSHQKSKKPHRTIQIPNDGAVGNEAKVRKDHVLASRELMDIIREEISKEEQLRDYRQKLEEDKTSISRTITLKENFFNALCTGVVRVNPPKVSYIEEKFGMVTKEIPLSEPRMEPFGKFVPLYQAFITYFEMPDSTRAMLDRLTEDRLNGSEEDKEKMKESCDHLLQVFTNQYMGDLQKQAQKCPDDEEKMVEFLIEFRETIDSFKSRNGIM